MVNPGHPSKSCRTCKMRKVRCDLARPVCGRCAKSERVCLGYTGGARKTPSPAIPRTEPNRQSWTLDSPHSAGIHVLSPHVERSISPFALLEYLFMRPGEVNQENPFDTTLGWQGANNAAISATRTIKRCLYFLRQLEQSFQERRTLLAEYGETTSALRAMLTDSPQSIAAIGAAFLFSLYEMIVTVDPSYRTWRIHLEGLLNILSHQMTNNQYLSVDDFDSLYQAIQIFQSKEDAFQILATDDSSSRIKAFLLIDVALLRLQALASEVESLLQTETPPRKLDVQKLRASIKNIQNNLKLIPKLCPEVELEMDTTKHSPSERLMNALLLVRWNNYHCLQLIIANLLISTGRFLHPSNNEHDYQHTREHSILSRIAHGAVPRICSTVPVILGTTPLSISASSIDLTCACAQRRPESGLAAKALLCLWPLCCTMKSPKVLSQAEQTWAQETLWFLGIDARIPLASALANSKGENTTWSDVLAGLLLIRVALSQEIEGLFNQLGAFQAAGN